MQDPNLVQDHTLKHFRKEAYFPKILDRTNYAGWEQLGRKTLDVKLKEKADEIIGSHKAEPIEPAAVKLINKIMTTANNSK